MLFGEKNDEGPRPQVCECRCQAISLSENRHRRAAIRVDGIRAMVTSVIGHPPLSIGLFWSLRPSSLENEMM
jgi:hypothetical protein